MSQRFLLFALTILSVPAVAAAKPQEVPTVRLSAEAQIAAPPATVWTHLTTGKSLVTWCPVWKSEANSAIQLTKVGDVLEFTDEWGNGGRSIVTFLAKDKELRVAHEPTNGSYMCQAKLVLEPKAGGTLVRYIESYTDESAPADRMATATKTAAGMAATLNSLKAQAEKK
jgi:uncharacterized protein YndB with AHSA1/START domain